MSKMYFSDDHEWIRVDAQVATVGITDHAQEQLGDIVFVELPQVGEAVARGDTTGVVESVKAASDIYSPLSGEIIETNSAVADDPALVNSAAESEGWMFRIELSDPGELDALMDAQAYSALIAAD